LAEPPRLRQPRLADMIAGRFRSQILDGSLPPGQRLPRQEELARELGVSLAVTREALRILEAQGLITVHRGKTGGATVRVPDRTALDPALATTLAAAAAAGTGPADVAATLAALDGLCAQTAAAQPDRSGLVPRLEASLAAQLGRAGGEAAFGLECGRFHAELSRGCGLAMLGSICDALARPPVTRRCQQPGLGPALILADHRRVITAIAAGQGQAAAADAAHRDSR
jgi:GntR family transcriptional repressor for pyruvate dehydrogenase complex